MLEVIVCILTISFVLHNTYIDYLKLYYYTKNVKLSCEVDPVLWDTELGENYAASLGAETSS